MHGEPMKRCFRCGSPRPLSSFYRHPRMADGHLNKCKECTKDDVSSNYWRRRTQYAEYERSRSQDPGRKANAVRYQREGRRRNPLKAAARLAVARAVASGRLVRQPCAVCGAPEVQSHHEDYARPLDVRWLCFEHHMEVHGRVVTRAPGRQPPGRPPAPPGAAAGPAPAATPPPHPWGGPGRLPPAGRRAPPPRRRTPAEPARQDDREPDQTPAPEP